MGVRVHEVIVDLHALHALVLPCICSHLLPLVDLEKFALQVGQFALDRRLLVIFRRIGGKIEDHGLEALDEGGLEQFHDVPLTGFGVQLY